MTTPKPQHSSRADTTHAVDDFMAALDHPFKELVQAIRAAILGVDARIAEGVKWNAPSFRLGEYFATVGLRDRRAIIVILHLGARTRDLPPDGMQVADPAGVLQWLAHDRAKIVFAGPADIAGKQAAFRAVVGQWVRKVQTPCSAPARPITPASDSP